MRNVLVSSLAVAFIAISGAYAEYLLPEFEGFIRVQGGRFVDAHCQEFPITGMNTWMLMEAAAGLAVIPCTLPDQDAVQYTFRTAARSGFTVVRTFAHGVNNTLPLQIKPGIYNETAFAALDYILDMAAYNGVKVIFTMGDNWQYADAKRNYNGWAGFNASSDLFWTSEITRKMYKNHMNTMVNRVNTLTGIMYKDDPTIFAWNLMNEPRCDCFPDALPYPAVFDNLPPGCAPSCANTITDWINEMSAYLKSIDPNHLVTVGEEGFWGYNDPDMHSNPETTVSPWAALTGNNFTAQHSSNDIDFATVHYWPDQWTPKATSDVPFFTGWMDVHAQNARTLGKPLVLEELGKGVTANSTRNVLEASVASRRQPFMEMVYSNFNQSLQSGGEWRGTLFWMWGFCPNNTNDLGLQVAKNDADFQNVIVPASQAAISQALYESPVTNCTQVAVKNVTVHSIPAKAAPSPQPLSTGTVRNPVQPSTGSSISAISAAG